MTELLSIQYLRAAAALMVVLLHLYPQWQRMGFEGAEPGWLAGGVDIFFVISGYIMWTTTARRPVGPLTFYRRRIARIVPLYWLLSAVVVGVMMVAPHAVQSTRFDLRHVLASFSFIAMESPSTGRVEPVLIPGWTLNYEMFFYLVFGLTLTLRENVRLAVTGIVLAALVALHPLAQRLGPVAAFYTSSIMLEFLAGMALGWLTAKDRLQGNRLTGWGLLLAGIVLMIALDGMEGVPRLAAMGAPATAIVAGALMLERAGGVPRMALPLRLGDASYSLYLSHPLILSALGQAWRKWGLADMPGGLAWFAGVAVVITLACGLAVYQLLEQPLLRVLRGRGRPKMPRARDGTARADARS